MVKIVESKEVSVNTFSYTFIYIFKLHAKTQMSIDFPPLK